MLFETYAVYLTKHIAHIDLMILPVSTLLSRRNKRILPSRMASKLQLIPGDMDVDIIPLAIYNENLLSFHMIPISTCLK